MLKYVFKFCLITLILFVVSGNIFAQTTETEKEQANFPYSKNPEAKSSKVEKKDQTAPKVAEQALEKTDQPVKEKNTVPEKTAENKEDTQLPEEVSSPSIASKTFEIAKREGEKAISPTEIYRVGVGDILFISLENAPPNVSTYFTVLKNGAIDYPLAGGLNFVLGMTPEEVENELRSKIELYDNPQISVKVREYSSHKITVLGLVEKPGIKYLQREAVPLFVVRAEAIVQPSANQVAIRRAETNKTEKLSLLESDNDNVLVFPGDIVEFSSILNKKPSVVVPQFYYIGGNVRSGGQMKFYKGMTLTQAVIAAGGLVRSRIKKVYLRRKNETGLLITKVYNLKKIENGLEPDPLIQAGDRIEIKK